jgi:hypothetical protein
MKERKTSIGMTGTGKRLKQTSIGETDTGKRGKQIIRDRKKRTRYK